MARSSRSLGVGLFVRVLTRTMVVIAMIAVSITWAGRMQDVRPVAASETETPMSRPVPLNPARLLETRAGLSTIDGQFEGAGRLAAGETIELHVTGRAGIPADADAVMLNVTAVVPLDYGYITVYPCGSPRPNTSNINYTPGDVAPNTVLAKIGDNGNVCLYTRASTHLLADVNAYVPAGGAPYTVDPARLLETRPGLSTIDGEFEGAGRLDAGETIELQVTERAGIPADADAVMLNVTTVVPLDHGYITVYPCGSPRPNTSNLNYAPGDIAPNAVLAKIGDDGNVCLYTRANTHLLADVNAYVPAGGAPYTVDPARLLETRPGLSTIDGQFEGAGRLAAGATIELHVTGRAGIPADADAVMLNVTAVVPVDHGYLTVFPCSSPRPNTSNINYAPGEFAPNAVLAKIGDDGNVCIYSRAATHLLADANAYVPADKCQALTSRASEAECRALVALFSTSDFLSVEHFGPDPCTWLGVQCTVTGVRSLDLLGFGIRGLPAEIGNLTNLTTLYLLENQITSLPAEFGNLTNLRIVDLSFNDITSLPAEIGNLTNLEELWLGKNQITNLPPEIGNLANLTDLHLRDNQISSIPTEIGNLTNLTELDVHRNQIASIPSEVGNLTNLTQLSLGGNQIANIPSEVGNLTNLTQLSLAGNQITTIPSQIGNLTNLTQLSLGGNQITTIPSQIGNFANLEALYISHNQITSIPPAIGNLTNLRYLRLDNNQITSIPLAIGDLTNVSTLRIDANEIAGDITATMAALQTGATSLRSLTLSGRGCPVISDPNVRVWVETFDPEWDTGCG